MWRTPRYAIDRFQSGPFERTSKRRKGFASESRVKRWQRIVHGDKELIEKLGRNDPCPCGVGTPLSSGAACEVVDFDGAPRNEYFRD
jgi:hypothetical protein